MNKVVDLQARMNFRKNDIIALGPSLDRLVNDDKAAYNVNKEINDGRKQVSPSYEGGASRMDETSRVLFERMDRDIRDFKKEAAEREERARKDAKEREDLARAEAKEREERMMSILSEMKSDFRNDLSDMRADINSKLSDIKSDTRASKNTLITLSVTTILGVAAMVIAVIVFLASQGTPPTGP